MGFYATGDVQAENRYYPVFHTHQSENRLITQESISAVPDQAKVRLEFAYDYMGRRVTKTVLSEHNGTAYQQTNEVTFVYDGWNLIAALDEDLVAGTTSTNFYLWGLDLSGSLQGAGGVGGLLATTQDGASYLACMDGNGNVIALVDASDGTLAGEYEYGPFGEPLKAHGDAAENNAVRFSSKYTDTESGLLYYGYRYLDPSTGRWPSRDPIRDITSTLVSDLGSLFLGRDHATAAPSLDSACAGGLAGLDLATRRLMMNTQGSDYQFTRNLPTQRTDLLGLADCDCFEFRLTRGWCEWGWPYIYRCFRDVPWDGKNPPNPRSEESIAFRIVPKDKPKCRTCGELRPWVETWHTRKYRHHQTHWPYEGGVYECRFDLEQKRIANVLGGSSAGIVLLPHCFFAVDSKFQPGSQIKIRWGTGTKVCGEPEWTVVK